MAGIRAGCDVRRIHPRQFEEESMKPLDIRKTMEAAKTKLAG